MIMAGNMFLKLETPNIEGESNDSGHVKEIQVLSWSHSFNQPTSPTRSSAGGGTVEQANHSDFTFSKYTDSATDDLLKQCWSGKQIKKGTFTAYRADGNNKAVKYLEIVMERHHRQQCLAERRYRRYRDRDGGAELRRCFV